MSTFIQEQATVKKTLKEHSEHLMVQQCIVFQGNNSGINFEVNVLGNKALFPQFSSFIARALAFHGLHVTGVYLKLSFAQRQDWSIIEVRALEPCNVVRLSCNFEKSF